MSMLIAPETPYGKELWKWEHTDSETHPSDPTVRGMRPTHPQPYPAMLYKATQKNPWQFEKVIAADEREANNLASRGFVMGGPQVAADAFDAHMQDLAVTAAARNYEDRNIGERARAEVHAAEQASSTHLGEIPRTPITRRGRPAKAKVTHATA